MAPYAYWFILALVLVGVEMATGTFYMLMLAMAAGIGGIAALAGWAPHLQMSLAGVAGILGTGILWRVRSAHASRAAPDVGFDIGQAVKVIKWHDNGSARVHYRGAEWDAEPESADTPHDASLYIKAMQGSKLILTQHKPQQ